MSRGLVYLGFTIPQPNRRKDHYKRDQIGPNSMGGLGLCILHQKRGPQQFKQAEGPLPGGGRFRQTGGGGETNSMGGRAGGGEAKAHECYPRRCPK